MEPHKVCADVILSTDSSISEEQKCRLLRLGRKPQSDIEQFSLWFPQIRVKFQTIKMGEISGGMRLPGKCTKMHPSVETFKWRSGRKPAQVRTARVNTWLPGNPESWPRQPGAYLSRFSGLTSWQSLAASKSGGPRQKPFENDDDFKPLSLKIHNTKKKHQIQRIENKTYRASIYKRCEDR